MSLTALLYLTELLDKISTVFTVIIVFYFIPLIIQIIVWFASCNDDKEVEFHKDVTRYLKIYMAKCWIIIILLGFNLFIPSKTTMYMMLGSSYLSNSHLPSQVSEILNLKLNDVIKELKKEAKE